MTLLVPKVLHEQREARKHGETEETRRYQLDDGGAAHGPV